MSNQFGEEAYRPFTPSPTSSSLTPRPFSIPVAGPSRQRDSSQRVESSPRDPEQIAKRLPCLPSPSRYTIPAPSSPSHSQDRLVGNAMDMEKINTDVLPKVLPTPKKKRTRTLTTPHQSAVLHQLLAKSRFPSTAVREEVGLSIGLSARKVQIWFQNQRQKARKPHTQKIVATSRQCPVSQGPDAGLLGALAVQNSASRNPSPHPHPDRNSGDEMRACAGGDSSDDARYFRAVRRPYLLGPGIPGTGTGRSDKLSALSSLSPDSRPTSPPDRGYLPPVGHFAHRNHRLGDLVRPKTTESLPHWSPCRTLPPLPTRRPAASESHVYPPLNMYHPPSHVMSLAPSAQQRSPSPDSRFTYPPPSAPHPPPVVVPPPYTLQPQPQWDKSAFLIAPPPSSSSWHSKAPPLASSNNGKITPSVRLGTIPMETGNVPQIHGHMPHATSARCGRYDPIRATFVPYSKFSASSPSSPALQPVNQADHE